MTENNKKNHTKDLSVAWDTFSKFLSECLEKTPTIIDKMIENDIMPRHVNADKKFLGGKQFQRSKELLKAAMAGKMAN